MESVCCCGAEYLGRGWCVAGAACPRQVIGLGSWAVTAQEIRRDQRWVSAFPDLDLGRIGLRGTAIRRRCYCGARGYEAGQCDAGSACPRQVIGGGSWTRTAKTLWRNPTWAEDFPGLDLRALGLEDLPRSRGPRGGTPSRTDEEARDEAGGAEYHDCDGMPGRIWLETEQGMPEKIWLNDEHKPGWYALSEITRDGMTLCPAFNLGICEGKPMLRTKRNKDRVAEGCAWGVHMCAITLRSGRVCGMPKHGAYTCRMLKRAIRLERYRDSVPEWSAASAQRGTEIGEEEQGHGPELSEVSVQRSTEAGAEEQESGGQDQVSLWDMMVETDSEDERDFLSSTFQTCHWAATPKWAPRADRDGESIPPMPTRPTPREVEAPFPFPQPPLARELPETVPGPPEPPDAMERENLVTEEDNRPTAAEICRGLGNRQVCTIDTAATHVVYSRNKEEGTAPWIWFALQVPHLWTADGASVRQDAHVTIYYGTGSAEEQAERIVEAMDQEVSRWRKNAEKGLEVTLWHNPEKEHMMRLHYAWTEVICGPGFYERLHQLSHLGRAAHRGPWAALRPRSSFHLSIRTGRRP